MIVSFRQGGGFAGLIWGCELDTSTMPAGEADALRGLVQQSEVERAGSIVQSRGRDVEVYEIVIRSGDREHRVRFDEMTLPEGLEPLIDFLRVRARPAPPR